MGSPLLLMKLDFQEYADFVENHECFFQEGVTSKKATTTENGMGDQWYGNLNNNNNDNSVFQ
jgi:hypothetical protein